MRAIIYVVGALLQLVVTIFLLRVLLPLARADARNQLSQAVIRLTNRVVLPLRKMLPPIGKVDTASLVALVLVQLIACFPSGPSAASRVQSPCRKRRLHRNRDPLP